MSTSTLSMVHHIKPYIPNGQGCQEVSSDLNNTSTATNNLVEFTNCHSEYNHYQDHHTAPRASTPLDYQNHHNSQHHHSPYQQQQSFSSPPPKMSAAPLPINTNAYQLNSNSNYHHANEQQQLNNSAQQQSGMGMHGNFGSVLTPATMLTTTESNCSASVSSDSETTTGTGKHNSSGAGKKRRPAPTLATGRRNLKSEPVEPEEANRRHKRRERNRMSAQKCRERKVSQIEELKGQVEILKENQSTMQQELGGILEEARGIFHSVQQRCSAGGQTVHLPYFNCLSEALGGPPALMTNEHQPASPPTMTEDIKPPVLLPSHQPLLVQANAELPLMMNQLHHQQQHPHEMSVTMESNSLMRDTPPSILDQVFWQYYQEDGSNQQQHGNDSVSNHTLSDPMLVQQHSLDQSGSMCDIVNY